MTDPERWLNSADAPPGMRELLLEAKQVGPSAAQKAALGAQLGVGSGAWLAPLVKVLGIAVVLGGAGAMVASSQGGRGEAPLEHQGQVLQGQVNPGTTALEVREGDSAASPPARAPSAPAVEVVSPAGDPENPEVVRSAQVAPATSKKPSEAYLLSQARAFLDKDPRKALQLIAQHERLYKNGVLAEEREVLEVRALTSSGRRAAAEAEAREFKKAHPDSIHHLPEAK